MTLTITEQTDGADATRGKIGAALQAASEAAGHPWNPVEITLVASRDGTELGWLSGQIIYGWAWIMLLAVEPAARGGGIGRALMARAEEIARNQGALGVNVDTFGFQAPNFYRDLGYEEVSRLPGRVAAEDRIFFKKNLT